MTDYYYETESEEAAIDDGRRRRGDRHSDAAALPEAEAIDAYRTENDEAGDYEDADYEDADYFDEPAAPAYADDVEADEDTAYGPDDGSDPYDDAAGDVYDRDTVEYEAEPPQRMSVAEAGATAVRRIRFDPTQERGQAHFDRASRHSRTVSRLKIILPVIAGLGVLGFIGFVQFAPTLDSAVISMSGIDITASSVTMDKPHISGFEGTKRAYEVGADRAVQNLQNPNLATMDKIDARISIGNGQTAHIVAELGDYDGDADTMTLSRGIVVTTTDGHQARLETANIDINKGLMTSSDPVEISTDGLQIKANAVEVQDQGKHVWFRNGVTVIYTPDAAKTGESKGKAGETPPEPTAADGSS